MSPAGTQSAEIGFGKTSYALAPAAGNVAHGGSSRQPLEKEKGRAMDNLERHRKLNPGSVANKLTRPWIHHPDYHGSVLSNKAKSKPQLLNSLPAHGASSQRPPRPSLQP